MIILILKIALFSCGFISEVTTDMSWKAFCLIHEGNQQFCVLKYTADLNPFTIHFSIKYKPMTMPRLVLQPVVISLEAKLAFLPDEVIRNGA